MTLVLSPVTAATVAVVAMVMFVLADVTIRAVVVVVLADVAVRRDRRASAAADQHQRQSSRRCNRFRAHVPSS